MLSYDIFEDGRAAHGDEAFAWGTVEDAVRDLSGLDGWDTAWLSDSSGAWTVRNGDPVEVEESGWVGAVRRYMGREEYECAVEYGGAAEAERRLKYEMACEASGWRDYPQTMAKIAECVRESLGDDYDNALDSMTSQQLGWLLKVSKDSYERGRRAER